MPKMRAKMKVTAVIPHGSDCETVKMNPVCKSDGYPADGLDENNNFARYTPGGSLELMINNPALVGQFKEGDLFYLDFTKAEA